MFREKKNPSNKETFTRKMTSNLLSNESSTEDGSNHKTNIYQLNQKGSPNIVILNNKLLYSNIQSVNSSQKTNYDFKNDILIKEIIGNENILEENKNQFRSLFNLDDNNKLDIEFNSNTKIKNIIPYSNSSLISKNIIKNNIFKNKEKSLDEYVKGNKIKNFKIKKSLNVNKLKIFNNDNIYNTPKKDLKNRTKKITLNSNEKDNNSGYNYTIFNVLKNKINNNENWKNISNISLSKLIFKNNSNLTKQDIKEMKEKKIQKIVQLMNCNSPSLNVNKLRKGKNGCLSLLSNLSNRKKKVITLQNNINFNDIININYKKHKKKLFLRINTDKKEKKNYNSNNDGEDKNANNRIKNEYKDSSLNNGINNIFRISKIEDGKTSNLIITNFQRKSEKNYNDLNNIEYTYIEKKKYTKNVSKKKMNHISLDSSHNILNNKIKKYNIYENIKYNNLPKEKKDFKNYKILLNDIQKRISYLIENLVNYIELLKKDK